MADGSLNKSLMNWSFSTLGCPQANWDEVMQLAERFSVPSVELRMLDGTDQLAQTFKNHFLTPAHAFEVQKGWSTRVCALGSSCRMIGGSPREWEGLLALAPWAEAMQIPYLRVFDSHALPEGLQESHFLEAEGFLRRWQEIKIANHWDVELVIETHSALTSAPSILKLQKKLATPAWLLWDSHHTWFKGGESPAITWPQIKTWVRHIHFKDSLRPDPGQPEANRHVLPGQGEYPFEILFSQLKDVGFSGAVSLEWEKHWQPGLPSIESALKACRAQGWW